MKRVFQLLTGLAIILVVAGSCTNNTLNISPEDKKAIIDEYLKANNLNYCNPCTEEAKAAPYDYLLEAHLLDTMVQMYKEKAKPITNLVAKNAGTGDVDDARAIWFSLDRLKGFISEIERSTCGGKCEQPLTLGIRMYYGRYPYPDPKQFADLKNIPDSFENRHTVFMIPTFDKNGYHIDFDPRTFNIEKACTPGELDAPLAGTYFGYSPLLDQHSMNHGELIPPPYSNFRDFGAYFIK